MKMRGRFLAFVVVISLVLLFQGACAYEYDASNISLDSIQIYGEPISGSFILSLVDAPSNLVFSSNLGNITLQQLFANSGKTLGCESYNCSGLYAAINNGRTSLDFVTKYTGVTYGLKFMGEGISSEDFKLKVSSQFNESSTLPLSIKVGKTFFWDFNTPSDNISNYRQLTYGCFNPSITSTNGNVNSLGYCEEVNLTDSSSYYLGANMSGSGVVDLTFSLIKDGIEIGNCPLVIDSASFAVPIGCFVSLSERQSAGKFKVCVKSSTDSSSVYSIKKETAGVNCGSYANGENVADYSLFVKVPFYSASAGEINLGETFGAYAVDAINYYLSEIYRGNCSAGCVVPITFYGNNKDLSISNLNSVYYSLSGPETSTQFYTLVDDVYRTSFSENISLSAFNWRINNYGNWSFDVYLMGDGATNKLFSKQTMVNRVPVATSIYPANPPAGLDVYFYASIGDNFTKSVWDFGDGTQSVETDKAFTKHRYTNVSTNYNLSITIYGINSSITKTFIITTISPENYINETLSSKRVNFNKITTEVEALPSLYKEFVKEKIQLGAIQEELNQIEILKTSALSSEDFLNIANRINLMVIPTSLFAYETKSGMLDFSYSSVDPAILSLINPGNYSVFEEYKSPIYTWQVKNIISNLTKKKFGMLKDNSEKVELMTTYDLTLKSKTNFTSYFVIQEPIANIHFSSGVIATDVNGNATYIQLSPFEEKSFSFFVEGARDLVMFVSPSLEVLPIVDEISVCNVNKVCQKDIGENSENCPEDCKSYTLIIWAMGGVLLLILIVYTILQFWYVVSYENFLFQDRAFVFNLLAFINNSKLNAKSRDEIYSILTSKGWTSEQINYVIKKSEGKNTGMFELLPIQKLVAFLEMRKAQKLKTEKVAPPVRTESLRNIQNRGGFLPRPPLRGNRPNNFGREDHKL